MKQVTNAEWNQFLSETPSNNDFLYFIKYTNKNNKAAEELLKRNPTNDDLQHIICRSNKKNEAAVKLLTKNLAIMIYFV